MCDLVEYLDSWLIFLKFGKDPDSLQKTFNTFQKAFKFIKR